MKKVAVIGAGIAGLTAAYELKKAGYDVTVFEKNSTTGGRMATRFEEDLPFDIGADFLAENYKEIKNYAKEFGVEWLPTVDDGLHRIMRDGRPYYLDFSSPLDAFRFSIVTVIERVKFFLFILYLKLRYGVLDFFNLSSLPAELDFDNAANYLEKIIGKEVNDYVADGFTGVMQFHRTDEISTAALFALMTMMTSSDNFKIRHASGGMGAIQGKMASNLSVKTGTSIDEVISLGHAVEIKFSGGNVVFDSVVLALPATCAIKIFKNPNDAQKKILESARYASTIVVSYKIPADLFSDGTHIAYVPFVENNVVSGYTNQARKSGIHVSKGQTLLNVYLHEGAAKRLMETSDKEIFEIVLGELIKVCPEIKIGEIKPEPYSLQRWPEAMPKFSHRYISIVRDNLKAAQGYGSVFLAGDYLNSPWTEGACWSGKRAAKLVIAD